MQSTQVEKLNEVLKIHLKRLGLVPSMTLKTFETPEDRGLILGLDYKFTNIKLLGTEHTKATQFNDFFRVLETDIMNSPAFRELFDKQKEEIQELKKLNEELLKYKTHFDMEVLKERGVNEDENFVIDVDASAGKLRNEGHSGEPNPTYSNRCYECGRQSGHRSDCTKHSTRRKDLERR